jgi:hypothetical protein
MSVTVEVGQRNLYKSCQELILLSWWSTPLSQVRWDHIWCGVLDSPVIAARGNWVVSRFVGRNRQHAVLGVQDTNSSPRAYRRVVSRGL